MENKTRLIIPRHIIGFTKWTFSVLFHDARNNHTPAVLRGLLASFHMLDVFGYFSIQREIIFGTIAHRYPTGFTDITWYSRSL